jgi:excisionase family DNA binding protein
MQSGYLDCMHADTTPADGTTALADDHQIAYKVPHAAQVLDLSERQVWELVRTGDIPSFKIGASRRILRSDLTAYADSLRAETHPPAGPSTPPPPSGPKASAA